MKPRAACLALFAFPLLLGGCTAGLLVDESFNPSTVLKAR